jgi:hypothetical protein
MALIAPYSSIYPNDPFDSDEYNVYNQIEIRFFQWESFLGILIRNDTYIRELDCALASQKISLAHLPITR